MLHGVQYLIATTDFVAEGTANFPHLAEMHLQGVDLGRYLCFVLVFEPDMPTQTNFYSCLTTSLTWAQVVALYAAHSWQVRKCSWTDFEIACDWAELVIESESPILMHGLVAEVERRVEDLLTPLRAADIAYRGECYGPEPDRKLLRTLEWHPSHHGSEGSDPCP